MRYKPELGFFGNLERAFEEMTKTNNKVFNTENEVKQIDHRVASAEEVNNITFVALAETKVLDDNTAARHPEVFEEWREGVYFEVGKMRRCPLNGKLYRVREGQAHTSVPGWEPSLTPAMWVVVDVTHAGTQDDPIPASRGMEFVYGLFYFDEEDGKLYRCERTGEAEGGKIVLHFMPHELVGQYFVEA
ncbi:MAG: hypothetical protein J6U65_03545 [Bacteroidaceae bacterium]|nr:hypothetical protein [Bacteroidaceae bacterium]